MVRVDGRKIKIVMEVNKLKRKNNVSNVYNKIMLNKVFYILKLKMKIDNK